MHTLYHVCQSMTVAMLRSVGCPLCGVVALLSSVHQAASGRIHHGSVSTPWPACLSSLNLPRLPGRIRRGGVLIASWSQ